jgi:peptide/nickel transport system permease protein
MEVLGFLARRLVTGVAVLWAGTFASFCFFATEYHPLKGTPLLPAYWRWLEGVFTGASLAHGLFGPLWPRVAPALGHTAALLAYTFVLVIVGAFVLATTAGLGRGSSADRGFRATSYAAWAIPPFVLGLVLSQLFAGFSTSRLTVFPPGGWPSSCSTYLHVYLCAPAGTGLAYLAHVLWYLTLPAVSLAAGFVGVHSRYLRSALMEALDAPYITTARAKGLSEPRILVRHALRNALVLFVPALLSDFGAVFGASLAIDLLFGLDGIGSLFLQTLNTGSTSNVLDAYAAQLLLLIGGTFVIVSSILGELAVGILDPRTKLR